MKDDNKEISPYTKAKNDEIAENMKETAKFLEEKMCYASEKMGSIYFEVSQKLNIELLSPDTIKLIKDSKPEFVNKLSGFYEQKGHEILDKLNRAEIRKTIEKSGIGEINTLEQAFCEQLATYNECRMLLEILDNITEFTEGIVTFIESNMGVKNTGTAISLIKHVGNEALEDLAINPGLIPALQKFNSYEKHEKAVRFFYSLCNVHSTKRYKQEQLAA